ncbi:unnamed protein product, partial [Allacma fusca]
GFSNLNILAGN